MADAQNMTDLGAEPRAAAMAEPTCGANERDHLRSVPRRFWPVPEKIQGESFAEALRRIADEYGACPNCCRYSTFRKFRDERGFVIGGVCGQCRYECGEY